MVVRVSPDDGIILTAGLPSNSPTTSSRPWDVGGSLPAEVVLIAGQSNTLRGRGKQVVPDEITSSMVYERQLDGTIRLCQESMQGAVPDNTNIGPGLAFGKAYTAAKNRHVILINGGVGSSGFINQRWNPGDPAFVTAVDYANATMVDLGSTAVFSGIVWHQGESDAKEAAATEASHAANLDAMFTAMRAQIIGASNCWIVLGELHPNVAAARVKGTEVQAAIRDTPNRITRSLFASSSGTSIYDGVHFDAASQRIMGPRYATAALSLGLA